MRLSLVLGCMAVLAGTMAAGAADMGRQPQWSQRSVERGYELPFPRSERAQSVWNSGACWSDCGAHCAWGMTGCLQRDEQGVCLAKGDTCDRYCLRQCRTMGGPLLPIAD